MRSNALRSHGGHCVPVLPLHKDSGSRLLDLGILGRSFHSLHFRFELLLNRREDWRI